MRRIFFPLLFNPEPLDGTGGGGTASGAHTTPPPVTDPSPGPGAASPPAAAAVAGSDSKESDAGELVETRRKLAEEQAARKNVEMRAAQLEDQVRTLSTPPTPSRKEKSKWFLMESEED